MGSRVVMGLIACLLTLPLPAAGQGRLAREFRGAAATSASATSTALQVAASSFGELQGRLKIGETVYVEIAGVTTGRRGAIKGRALELSGSTLRLLVDGQRRDLAEREVLVVSERHRSRGKGALIGLAIGGGLGLLNVARWCRGTDRDSCGNAQGALVLLSGLGAAFGSAVAPEREHILYLAPNPR